MIQKLDMYPNKLGFNEINAFINNENELWPYEHSHSYYEFMLIERGSLIQTIDGKDIILYKNDICILRPDTVHSVKRNGNDSIVLVNFEINIDFLDRLTKELGLDLSNELLRDKAVYLKCPEHDLHNYMQLLTTAYNIKELNRSQACLKNIIIKLLSKLVDYHFLTAVNINDNSIIASFLNELNDPSNFCLSIENICRKKSYSHEHISRLFKQANLAAPNKIFLKNKLAFSCTFLKTSTMPIIKIAEMCGIYTVSYFNKAFKNEYNISPSQYRKNNKTYDKFTSHEYRKHNHAII